VYVKGTNRHTLPGPVGPAPLGRTYGLVLGGRALVAQPLGRGPVGPPAWVWPLGPSPSFGPGPVCLPLGALALWARWALPCVLACPALRACVPGLRACARGPARRAARAGPAFSWPGPGVGPGPVGADPWGLGFVLLWPARGAGPLGSSAGPGPSGPGPLGRRPWGASRWARPGGPCAGGPAIVARPCVPVPWGHVA